MAGEQGRKAALNGWTAATHTRRLTTHEKNGSSSKSLVRLLNISTDVENGTQVKQTVIQIFIGDLRGVSPGVQGLWSYYEVSSLQHDLNLQCTTICHVTSVHPSDWLVIQRREKVPSVGQYVVDGCHDNGPLELSTSMVVFLHLITITKRYF